MQSNNEKLRGMILSVSPGCGKSAWAEAMAREYPSITEALTTPIEVEPNIRYYHNMTFSDTEKETVMAISLETDEGRKRLAEAMEKDIATIACMVNRKHKCHCTRQQLMREGCKCGGV